MAPMIDYSREAGSVPAMSGGFLNAESARGLSFDRMPGTLERIVIPLEKQWDWAHVKLFWNDAPLCIWCDPEGQLDFVAWGAVEHREFRGAQRFQQAEQWCSGIFEQLGSVKPDLPAVVGGFAFAESDLRYGSSWKNWPDGNLVLPERLLYRRRLEDGSQEAGVIVHRRLRGYGDEGFDAADIQERIFRPVEEGMPSTEAGSCSYADVQRARFESQVSEALASIARGELSKVVVARTARLLPPKGKTVDVESTIRRICDGGEQGIGFALAFPDRGVFVGRTPEVLLRVDKGCFSTHAVAGTSRRGQTPSDDAALGRALLSSSKERHEHALVVQGIEKALHPLCQELEFSEQAGLVKLETVQHLSTGIRGAFNEGCTVLDAVARMHPTPALCGSPSNAARTWITNHESAERGWYAGPVGWMAPDGAGTFAVAIRSALVRDSQVVAFGGAGIVEGSEPHREWDETELKIDAVARHIVTGEVQE